MKGNAKEKKACTQRYSNGTGGGPKGKTLTEMEERIVSLIGDVVCNGIPNIPEFGTGTIEQLNILMSPDENHSTNIDNSQEVINLYIFYTHILNIDVLVYLFYYLILLVYSNVYTMFFYINISFYNFILIFNLGYIKFM